MSIFFNFDVGANGRRFRRAVDGDKADIESILDKTCTEKLFGDVDIGSLIELSVLSICMIDESKDVTGFIALSDHPNVPGVDEADWENWMRNMFQKYYLSRNTLFIHFMCCIDDVTDYFLEEALISVFREDAYLLYIVLVVPNGCPEACLSRHLKFKKRNLYKYLSKKKTSIIVDTDSTENRCNCIYTAMRQDFCPKLKIRRAVEEDNDDIIALLDQKCPTLKEKYGEYCISEIIGRHPEMKRQVIAADYQGRAIGVMCLNAEINYERLHNTYELHPYHGLKKASTLEKEKNKRSNVMLKTYGEPILYGKWGPFDRTKLKKHIDTEKSSHESFAESNTDHISKVIFRHNSLKQNNLECIYNKNETSDDYSAKFYATSPTSSFISNISVTHLLDEDPFDYEIVNIDTNLLSLPHVFSAEFEPEIFPSSTQTGMMGLEAKLKRRTSAYICKTIDSPKEVKYTGEPNAFIIELLGFRENLDFRQAFDLLEAAFEAMSAYDYCIIRVPCSEKLSRCCNIFFVPTKPNVFNKYALYIAHKNSVLGKLRVRSAELIDVPLIAQLLDTLDVKDTLWTIENTIRRGIERVFVMLSGCSIVGLGVLEPVEQMPYIHTKYNIDSYHINKYHYRTQGAMAGFSALKTVLAYPVFEAHFRYFAREMMRLSNSSTLLWLSAYRNKWVAHKANTLAISMIPLIPRKSEVDCATVPEIKKSNVISSSLEAFSTWFISRKFTTLPKLNVDARIVVVGASRTTMAFLNALLFSDSCTYLTFTNVTLVSPNGLPYVRHSKGLVESMFLKCRTNTDKYLKTVPYTYYVNVIQGTMTEINRRSKYITLANGSKYYYDLLFLLFGKQYQHPNYMKSILKREEINFHQAPKYTRLDVPKCSTEDDYANKNIPKNFFVINNLADANKALKYVKNNLLWFESCNILVYGATIHAYCCLYTLLQMGVPKHNIVYVEPFPSENPRKPRVTVFANNNVDKTVNKMMEELKITIYRSYYFQSWICGYDDLVTSVNFMSQYKMLNILCSAIFYYGHQGVDEAAFVAINKSGIAYNKGILIDHQFRTKDESIYAAGPATRYNSIYYAEDKRQMYYDSYEIGTKLGEQIRNQLDPLFEYSTKKDENKESTAQNECAKSARSSYIDNEKKSTSKTSVECEIIEKVPDLKQPEVMHCILPGGLRYLEVRSPRMKTPCYYIQSLQYNGHIIETFKEGYFKLHLTKDLIVDGITCLTLDKRPLENFINIYGKPSVVLNNVFLRYTANKLDDLYDFFRSPWAYFLYHDKSDELFAMIKELLPKGQRHGETLKETMYSIGERSNAMTCARNVKLKMRSTFETSPYMEAITDYVMDWLSENEALLPLYLQPWHRSEYSRDTDSNPAFKKRKRSIIRMLNAIY